MQYRTAMQGKVRGIKGNIKPKIQKAKLVNGETGEIEKYYFVDEILIFYYGRQNSL